MKVSRITKFLLAEGYIRRKRGTRSPAQYNPTKKPFPRCNTTDQWDWSEGFEEEIFGGHYNKWKMRVNGPPVKGFPWEWDKHGTQDPPHHLVFDIKLDTREGPVDIKALRYINGKKKKSITVWLDNDALRTDEEIVNWTEWSRERLILVWRELQYMTGMHLGLPEPVSDGHIDRRIRAGVAHAWKEMGLDDDDEYVDYSKGEGKPTWETTDGKKALAIKTVPKRVDSLEEEAARAAVERERLAREAREYADRVVNGTTRTRDAQDELNQAQAEFNKAVTERLSEGAETPEKAKVTEAATDYHDYMYG